MNTAISDIEVLIRNHASECETRALRAKQASIRAAETAVYGKELERARDKEVAGHDSEAAVWTARKQVADTGNVLVDPSDSTFMLTHGELISKASVAHRVRFPEGDEGERRQAERHGMTPYAPGTRTNPNMPR